MMRTAQERALGFGRGWRHWAALMAVVCLSWIFLGADTDHEGLYKTTRSKFREKKSKDTVILKDKRPVEVIFADAEARFASRETWYGRMVKKVYGEKSKAYEKLPGVHRQNVTKAKLLYKRVVDNYPFSSLAPVSELRVADCHYKLKEYEVAGVWYEQFVKKHAKREEVPYAMFQQGMCQFKRMRKPGRDQKHAKGAELTFQLLIDRYPDSKYAGEAKVKLVKCQKNLAKHELGVADFYFKKREYWSAAARYNGIWKNYPKLGLDDQAMFKEAECYNKLGKKDLARNLYEQTAKDFSQSDYGKKAGDRLRSLDRK
jgi:outer membrane protein assembly factor BamD